MQVSIPLVVARPRCTCRRCEPGVPECGGEESHEVLVTAEVRSTDEDWLPLEQVEVDEGFTWADLSETEKSEAEERLHTAYEREVEKLRRSFPAVLGRAQRALAAYLQRGETGAVDHLLEELTEFARKGEH